MVARLAQEAGITKKISPHSLRATAITLLLDCSNGNVRKAQRFARHADVTTRMRYDPAREDLDNHSTFELEEYLGVVYVHRHKPPQEGRAASLGRGEGKPPPTRRLGRRQLPEHQRLALHLLRGQYLKQAVLLVLSDLNGTVHAEVSTDYGENDEAKFLTRGLRLLRLLQGPNVPLCPQD